MKAMLLVAASLCVAGSAGLARAEVPFEAEIARTHYRLGTKYYGVGSYDKALEEFKKAYEAEQRPALLFNMGKCHELLGQKEQAIEAYSRYLKAVPDASNRATLELKVKNMRRALARDKAPEPAPAPVKPATQPATRPAPVVQPQPVEPAPVEGRAGAPAWTRTAGWAALGTGGACLIAGAIVGGMVPAKQQDYQDAAAAGQTYGELEQIADQGRTLETAQVALLISGGVLAAAGGGLLVYSLLGASKESAPAVVSVTPLAGPVLGFAATARF